MKIFEFFCKSQFLDKKFKKYKFKKILFRYIDSLKNEESQSQGTILSRYIWEYIYSSAYVTSLKLLSSRMTVGLPIQVTPESKWLLSRSVSL